MPDLALTLIILWAALFVFTLVIELATPNLVSIWFTMGALVALILAIFQVPWFIQAPAFIVVSIAALLASRPIYKRFLQNKNPDSITNTDALVGVELDLITPISENTDGSVKVRDVVWSASAAKPLAAGVRVKIIKIAGNRLIVQKVEPQEENHV